MPIRFKEKASENLRIYAGDAQVWMNVAAELYQRAAFPSRMAWPSANELNVANVCTGYAFELAYKALVQSTGQIPISSHRVRDAHEKLDRDTGMKVESIILAHGWSNVDQFLNYFDATLRHEERRYWMTPKEQATDDTVVKHHVSYGYSGIDSLAKLHHELIVLYEDLLAQDRDEDTEGGS